MIRSPRILVFGGIGQVGSETCSLFRHAGYEVIAPEPQECDLETNGAAAAVISRVRPAVIVNTAAYTAVDRAEAEPERARKLNALAPAEMAHAARDNAAVFFHFSTDYVFDGASRRPYLEEDPPNPLGVYGRTKLEGDQAVLREDAVGFVFRTSWVYASHGTNFVHTMLRLGAEREQLSVVDDQVGQPTAARDLACLLLQVVHRFTNDGAVDLRSARDLAGLYNASGEDEISWCTFARTIFEMAKTLGMNLSVRHVRPIRTDEYASAASRPKYSVLSNKKLHEKFHIILPSWRQSLPIVLAEIAALSEVRAGRAV